jgi:predicted glycoside hydrolase/deacetylase ChbG (UPF0249 family)
MKKLIVNADDFGYRDNINKGILQAHQSGVVTSASLFVERDGTDEAVRMAMEHPELALGIHIDIDKYFNIEHGHGVITGWADGILNHECLKVEMRRQLDKFYSFGFSADHFDSHHHAHLVKEVFPAACEVAKEYKIPFMRVFAQHYPDATSFETAKKMALDNGLRVVDHFIEGWYWGNVDEDYAVAELMTHPGYGELWREAELAHCCQAQLKQYLMNQQIEPVRFSDVASH